MKHRILVTVSEVKIVRGLMMAAAAGILGGAIPAHGGGVQGAGPQTVIGGSSIVPLPHKATVTAKSMPEDAAVPGEPMPETTGVAMLFKSASGGLETGIFENSPGSLAMKDYPRDEVNYVISGSLTLYDASTGLSTVFKTGQHYAIPRGFNGRWENSVPVRVLFVATPLP